MKKIVLSLLIIVNVYSAFSQRHVNMQVYGSYVRNVNPDFRGTAPGAGLRIETFKEDAVFSKYFGVHYTSPITLAEPAQANAKSSATDPSSMSITANYKVANYRLEYGSRYYFKGEANEYKGFNFYANMGVELWYFTNRLTYSGYDEELYEPQTFFTQDSDVNPDGSDKFGLSFALAIGAGFEKNI